MDKKNASKLNLFLYDLNHNISDIENERFFVYVPEIPIRGNHIKVCVKDRIADKTYEHYFKWYVLRSKNDDYFYPMDMITWINNVIVENRIL